MPKKKDMSKPVRHGVPIPNDRQKKYIKARLGGFNKTQSKQIAGYHKDYSSTLIENQKAVKNALVLALDTVGANEMYLATKLKEGIDQADTAKTVVINNKTGETVQDPDLGAKHNFLKLLSSMRGYAKPEQQTNVYNQYGDNTTITDGEARSLIADIRAEIQARKSSGHVQQPSEIIDTTAYPAVDDDSKGMPPVCGGGQP